MLRLAPARMIVHLKRTDEIGKLLELLKEESPQDLAFFQGIWREHDPAHWAGVRSLHRRFGERILRIGEPLLAYDVLSEGLKSFPDDPGLRQLLALALARSGAAESANRLLAQLYREGHRDEETLGLLARTHKDLAAAAPREEQRLEELRQAYRFYAEAYDTTGGYWTGINAATVACLLNHKKRSQALAAEVQAKCTSCLKKAKGRSAERFWLLSTLGEAALIQQNWDEAERRYREAVHAGQGDWGSLQSTRHNAQLLIDHLGARAVELERLFRFPTVTVFSGHLLDHPTRKVPRFPATMIERVTDEIRSRLRGLNARIGYASAACGADILFHEVMLEAGGEIHVVLPFSRELFVRKSVATIGDGEWVKRFDRVLSKAVEVQELSHHDHDQGSAAWEYDNRMLHGLARLRAEHLETQLIPMAVWDGKAGDGPGGTADNVARWQKLGLNVEIIHPEGKHHTSLASRRPRVTPRRTADRKSDFSLDIRGLLFADFEGFSKLNDTEVPRFVTECMGLVGELAKDSRHRPVMKNTWGDGVYLVFATMRDSGLFALELCEELAQVNWSEKRLPEMRVRIGLHAGPVFRCTDPVTHRTTYIGAHVSRAARIEPVTPPGNVYASQPFAALAAAEGVSEFRCDYVGQTSLAKKYGTYPTYVVLRRTPAL